MENNVKTIIEALLFASDKPLTPAQIKDVLEDMENSQIKSNLDELCLEYEKDNRGIRIVEVAGGFRMVTPPETARYLKKLFRGRRIEKTSKPALETLAIIAYKQPITKSEIELLRNVNVDGVINSLMEKDLIRVVGRKNSPGRPFVLGTTRVFLEYFGLKSLEDLPKIERFQELKVVQEIKN